MEPLMRTAEITGTVRATRSGFAFLERDDGGEDLLLAGGAMGGAIHGDRVRVSLHERSPYDFRPEAHVEEILARPDPYFTGNVFRLGRSWFVRPDSPLLPERLRLRLDTADAVAGEKILFRVENFHDRERTPIAVFEEAIGDEEDARLDRLVIATEFGLKERFSDAALDEADSGVRAPGLEEARGADPEDAKREDFRGQMVLTIDPEDAKDFDDAVACERIPGGFELIVHIADVSFYVPEGGVLDREAAARGTSVYFPGSVVPMLPEAISTGAASLSPDEDKRVLSVRMRFNEEAERTAARISRGWIRSRARLHYRQALRILEGREEVGEDLRGTLRVMADLAARLRRRRFGEGGFDLEVPETEMVLGSDGIPIRVFRHETLESHRLIEEFMIAANRAVGEWALERDAPFLFRVHEEPDLEALTRFEETVFTLMPGTSPAELSSLPRLRRWISSLPRTPLGGIVHRFFLRSLKKAVYSNVDLGHFGLGIRGYCHFTSPIRRYPDLFDHRRIKELLDGRRPSGAFEDVVALAKASSRAEVNAEEAEREMIRLKAVRYMERNLGEEAAGHVTALTPHGLFVELDEIPVEGFVAREGLPPGVRYEGERMSWIAERSGWELRPGDPVHVVVGRCDLRARRIDFFLAATGARKTRARELSGEEGRPARRGRGRSAKKRARVRSSSTRSSARTARSGASTRPSRASSRKARSTRRQPAAARVRRGAKVRRNGHRRKGR
jgi:ribonuclease R